MDLQEAIIKFLSNTASSEELDFLIENIEKKENKKIFKSYIKTHFAISIAMHKPNTKKAKKEFLLNIKNEKRRGRLRVINSVVKYAAVVLIMIGGAFTYKHYYDINQSATSNTKIIPREGQVILQLENGEKQIISGSKPIKNIKGKTIAKSDGTSILYENKITNDKKLVYNKLTVPYGKKIDLVLSDGTRVTLNSGSSLKYPVDFVKDGERKVFLQGEAFFDVTPNKEKPFYVEAQAINVKVYGTSFNFKNYQEETDTEVVLVEGSVSMQLNKSSKNEVQETILKPGDKASFNKNNKNITKTKVDTSIYTSWIHGNLVFRDEPFKNIIKALERSYNVIIINNNKEVINESFNATIETNNESIEQVLSYFEKVYDIDYKIIENKVVIN